MVPNVGLIGSFTLCPPDSRTPLPGETSHSLQAVEGPGSYPSVSPGTDRTPPPGPAGGAAGVVPGAGSEG